MHLSDDVTLFHAFFWLAGEEGALRLTDGGDGGATSAGFGILEIFHAGAWGTFCEGVPDSGLYDYGPVQTFTEVRSSEVVCSSSARRTGHALYTCGEVITFHVIRQLYHQQYRSSPALADMKWFNTSDCCLPHVGGKITMLDVACMSLVSQALVCDVSGHVGPGPG